MAFAESTDLETYLHYSAGSLLTTADFFLEVASEVVRAWTHQQIDPVDDEVLYVDVPGGAQDILLLPELPVYDVKQVVIKPLATDALTLSNTANVDYRWTSTGLLYRLGTPRRNWPTGHGAVKVTYSHGYGDYPANVVGVTCSIAGRLFEQGGVISENISTYAATYVASGPGLTPNEQAALFSLKRRA